MNRISLLSTFVFLAFAGFPRAQDITVEMGPEDKGRDLPTTANNKGILKEGLWTAFENFQLQKSPDAKSPPSGYKPLTYLEHFEASHEYQGDGVIYYLLCRGKGAEFKNYGWIPARYVCFHNAQTNQNQIFKKALIVNSLDQIKSLKKAEPIPVRKGPLETASAIEQLLLYNIYYIYGDTQPTSPTEGYCLLGTDFGFDVLPQYKTNLSSPAAIVKGWVAKKNLCLWDTREALEWDYKSTLPERGENRRTGPVKIFHTREDAIKEANGAPVKPWFQESFDPKGVSKPMEHYSQRYPVIPLKKGEGIELPQFGKLFKIGSIGGFFDENGNELASKDQLEKLRRKLDDLQFEVASTDLVFVIDDTESMEQYFAAAAECVEKILEAVKKEKGKVRVGLAFYNDIPFDQRNNAENLDKAVDINPLVDIVGPGGEKIIQKLKDHKTKRGGDPREQMFHGLNSALEKMGFSRQSRKIVILIGDTGDHDTNPDGDFLKESKIVEKMVFEDRSPIEFFGIQVVPPKDNSDLNAFKSQVNKIIDFSHAKMKSLETKDAEGKVVGTQMDGRQNLYVQISDVDEVIGQIMKRYKDLREKQEATRLEIAKVGGGQWTRVSPEVERILKQENVDLDVLRKTKGLQVFDYGWVWEKGQPQNCSCNQVRQKMLAEEKDRLDLARLLYDIEHAVPGRRPTPEIIAGILNKTATGEKEGPAGNLELNRLKSLGLVGRSPLLNRALGEMKEDTAFHKELENIFLKRRALEDIGLDQNGEFSFVDKIDGNNNPVREIIRKGEPEKKLRMFRNAGSSHATKWVWLDYEGEWP
ncbi:MAG: VWA domain-containing protein [Gemmataceae bacterium]|nr:VWA domain-containing protein [Gemmataceae bacterium]